MTGALTFAASPARVGQPARRTGTGPRCRQPTLSPAHVAHSGRPTLNSPHGALGLAHAVASPRCVLGPAHAEQPARPSPSALTAVTSTDEGHQPRRRRALSARTRDVGTDARYIPLAVSTTPSQCQQRASTPAWAGSPICPRGTHTRTPIYETPTAHKGMIPPLCAVRCCLIPSLVCDTGGMDAENGQEQGRTHRQNGGTAGNRGCWIPTAPRETANQNSARARRPARPGHGAWGDCGPERHPWG